MRLHGHNPRYGMAASPPGRNRRFVTQKSWGLIQRYFEAVLGRYSSTQWDVINEPIETGYRMDGLRGSVFLQAFGPDYIPRALNEARRLAPGAELMINEFALETEDRVENIAATFS